MNDMNELDALIDSIGEWILQDEIQPGVLNPIRLQQMQFSSGLLQKMAAREDIQIKCEFGEPFRSMGYISLEGTSLEFTDCRWFSRAISFASNVDIYPLTNGNIKMVLTFHGLVKPISQQ